jgi:hypothetical protein
VQLTPEELDGLAESYVDWVTSGDCVPGGPGGRLTLSAAERGRYVQAHRTVLERVLKHLDGQGYTLVRKN